MRALAVVNGTVFSSRAGDAPSRGAVGAIDGRIVTVGPTPPEQIAELGVAATIVEGTVVFAASPAAARG